MSPRELYNKLRSTGRSSIYGEFYGVYGLYTISDTNMYFHSSSEKLRGTMPTPTERNRHIDISNAMAKYPYSWPLGIYSENEYGISIGVPIVNPVVKLSAKEEQKNNVYIIRKRKYITINQNY